MVCLIIPVGCSAACAGVGLAAVGTVVLVAGNAGIGGVLPGRGVPLLTESLLSKVLLQGFSFVAWCQVFGTHPQCSHCCNCFFLSTTVLL